MRLKIILAAFCAALLAQSVALAQPGPPPASQSQPPSVKSNNYFIPEQGTMAAGSAPSLNNLYAKVFYLDKAVTVAELGARVTTLAGSAGSGKFQLAIYAFDAPNGKCTGTPLVTTTTGAGNGLVTDAVGNVSQAVVTPALLTPGLYCRALQPNSVAAAVAIYQIVGNAEVHALSYVGSATLGNVTNGSANGQLAYSYSGQTFGTWPDLTALTATESSADRGAAIIIRAQ
jgi:hypothetical protein